MNASGREIRVTLSLRRLAQRGVRRQTEVRLDCYKGDLTWAARNRVYGGGNTIDKQGYGAKQTSYELTVRKFRHFARSLEALLEERKKEKEKLRTKEAPTSKSDARAMG
jgi:hypothetical protein